ncbi:Heterokaryon incompatibility protein 6- OR allele [Apiospora kogelbergensis]|uniref:Heterokaryon incompatibility protein 6- OR allele n=1 Tax=Apiospora kogelbergensis TaxID=1337665 RepID=A0AAW0QY01_9PEZI
MYSSPGQTLNLLDLGRSCQAADPKDKIFSLLGLMPGGRMGPITSDYTVDTCQLYAKVAQHVASEFGWLAVLARAGSYNTAMDSLPSWVPDWSHSLSFSSVNLKNVPFYPPKIGTCDAAGKALTISLLRRGSRHFQAGNPDSASLDVYWDSYVLQNTETHLWEAAYQLKPLIRPAGVQAGQRHRFLNAVAGSCLRHFKLLLLATESTALKDPCPPIIFHDAWFVDLRLQYSEGETNAISETYRLLGVQTMMDLHPLCGVPIETAVQIFTMTIGEMLFSDLFATLEASLSTLNGRKPPIRDPEETAEFDKSFQSVILEVLDVLSLLPPIDEALGQLWMRKYNAGELVGVEARNQSGLRVVVFNFHQVGHEMRKKISQNDIESGPWSTHHPLFAAANDTLWKMFLHCFKYREVSYTFI